MMRDKEKSEGELGASLRWYCIWGFLFMGAFIWLPYLADSKAPDTPARVDDKRSMALCYSQSRNQMLSYMDGAVTLIESGGKQTTILEAAEINNWIAYQGRPENGGFECKILRGA